ncbi:MAG: hypothetical protein ACM30E_07260, partial [Nitrososphaerales archaeon]
DYIGEGLALFVRLRGQGVRSFHLDRHLSLAEEPAALGELLDSAFDMLRHASCDNASVLLHMLDVIEGISCETNSPEALQLLSRHVWLIEAESHAGNLIEQDQEAVQRRSEALLMKLGHPPGEASQPIALSTT